MRFGQKTLRTIKTLGAVSMKVSIRTEIDVHSPSVVASRCRPSHVRATRVAGTAGTWILHIGIKLEATPATIFISAGSTHMGGCSCLQVRPLLIGVVSSIRLQTGIEARVRRVGGRFPAGVPIRAL